MAFYNKVQQDMLDNALSAHFKTIYEPGQSLLKYATRCFREIETLMLEVRKFGEDYSLRQTGTKVRQMAINGLLNMQDELKIDLIRTIPTFMMTQKDDDLGDVLGRISDAKTDEQLIAQARIMSILMVAISYVYQHLNPPKRYAIQPGLLDRLAHTEVRGILGHQIKTPFPSIYVETKDTDFFFASSDHQHIRVIHVSRYTRSKEQPDEYLMYATDLHLLANEKIGKDHTEDEFERLLLNILLYLTNAHFREELKPEATNQEWVSLGQRIQKLPPGGKKERLKERRKLLDPEYKIILGRGVKSMQETKDELDKTKQMVRVLVSGHWRNQIYGPRFDLMGFPIPPEQRRHESIWIEPFYRGEDWMEEGAPIRIAK